MSVQQNMEMVLQALKNAGFNDNQARILGAEIGREGGFLDRNLWGYHTDAHNGLTNVGMISWQGKRGTAIKKHLQEAGLIKNGKIVKGQASLDVMAKFIVHEMRTNPLYAQTKRLFLDNPNVDYATGSRVLGKNYILWRYDDRRYTKGHKNRDHFYKKLGGIVPTGGQAQMGEVASVEPKRLTFEPPQDPTLPLLPDVGVPPISPLMQTETTSADAQGTMIDRPFGLNMDIMSILQGAGANQMRGLTVPMLPLSFS